MIIKKFLLIFLLIGAVSYGLFTKLYPFLAQNHPQQSAEMIIIEGWMADAELKEININTDIPGFLNVFADQNMIDFVFRNLISNAIKFTPRNGNIFVRAKTHDNRIICQVEDTGIGMKPEILENLFKLGSSKSSPGTEGETGTGLGLILCKEFIKKNRGSIWVESDPDSYREGKGSKFFFSLPVSEHY